jgi:arsenate reductase
MGRGPQGSRRLPSQAPHHAGIIDIACEESFLKVTIYHNPACGTSRNTLAMIRQSGEEPEVIEYLKTPPSRVRLLELIKAMNIPVRGLLREKGTPYAELGLADSKWSDDELIDFMLAHPILIQRPIVVTAKGVRLCRPSELVLGLLDNPVTSFVKEDGEAVKDKR